MRALRWFLAPLAPLYGGIVRARNRAFDQHPERCHRVDAPVVSIGNLSTGGTGKTPVSLFLARGLEASGWPVAVLSRGYGGRRKIDPMDVVPLSDARETGDEPLLMARALGGGKVVVGRRRHAAALRALSRSPRPQVLLLDDGFQHRALHRDLDLLLLDGIRRWGNGRLLPLGDLREPSSSARRAHALVVTRASRALRPDIETWWARHGSGGPIFWVDFRLQALRNLATGERLELPGAALGPLLAFCALGHPEAFYADLLVAGLSWVDTRSFRDHQPLGPAQLRALADAALAAGARALVCTEKDAVKFDPAWAAALPLPLWVAEQGVEAGEPLLTFVRERLEALTAP